MEVNSPENRYSSKMYNRLQVTEGDVKEIDFSPDPERLRQDNLDVFERHKFEVMYTAKYAKDCDIGTTYMGPSNMRRQDDLKAEHRVHIMVDFYMKLKLLNEAICRILLDTAGSRSFMSKKFYLNCPSLDPLP